MMTVAKPISAVSADEDMLVAARAAAADFPDAPLAMPVQDMSPVTLLDVVQGLLPAVLRRRLSRRTAIRH